jgi:hypothetical protein
MIYNNHLFLLTWKLDIYTLIIQSHEKQEEKDKLVARLVNLTGSEEEERIHGIAMGVVRKDEKFLTNKIALDIRHQAIKDVIENV